MREKKYRYTIVDKDVYGSIGFTPCTSRNLRNHIEGGCTVWVACVDNRTNTVQSIMCYDMMDELYRYLTYRVCNSKGVVIAGMRTYVHDAISELAARFSLSDKIKEVLRID